jgi:3'-5' exoribonuclease
MFHWDFWEPAMQALMQAVEDDLRREGVWDKIGAIPAGASYHHNVRGGFLLHIMELLDFAAGLCQVQIQPDKTLAVTGPWDYPGLIDFQILRAAIVLHDIGKLYDYDEQTLQYQANPVSDCLEHTIVGILLVDRYWVNDSSEARERGLRLKHALAAHHGMEMGAVKPKTPEAIILHHLDMISAHLDVCRQAYASAKKTGSSAVEYSRMLGARPFVPAFFPPDRSVYASKADLIRDDIETKAAEPETGGSGKLPWEN